MKKFLVLFLVLATNSSGFAQTEGRCGLPEGIQCQDFYSRFDAFKRLQAIENGLADTEGNLTLIETTQGRLNLNLEYLVETFIYIQKSVGGGGATAQARETFSLVAGHVSAKNQLHDLASAMVELLTVESGLPDAQGNFSLVMGYVRSGQIALKFGVDFFKAVLALEGGEGATLNGRASFQMLLAQAGKYPLERLFASYESLLRAESGRDDAVGNFALVISGAAKCGSLDRATSDFIQVLNQVGGAGATSAARSLYKRLYGI